MRRKLGPALGDIVAPLHRIELQQLTVRDIFENEAIGFKLHHAPPHCCLSIGRSGIAPNVSSLQVLRHRGIRPAFDLNRKREELIPRCGELCKKPTKHDVFCPTSKMSHTAAWRGACSSTTRDKRSCWL